MSETELYLDPSVVCEPLVNQWYAHPLLLSPATAAMTMAGSHLPVMRSYVRAPRAHADALKNPAMRGGPFVDYQGGRVEEIKSLLERTLARQGPMLELAAALKELDRLLLGEARGYSLEPLYERVPEPLRGYVELVYDHNHHPSFRLIEGLLYRSPYHDRSLQGLALFRHERDRRPFIFSTPRLSDDRHVHLQLPFDSPLIDELFALRAEPQPVGRLRELLGEKLEPLRQFLGETAPPRQDGAFAGDGVRIRYFGHACVLLQTAEVSILTDPLVSAAFPGGPPRFTLADLPQTIDYVLITHNHQDHVILETLLPLRRRIRQVIVPPHGGGALEDPSLKLELQHAGFRQVYEIGEMERIEVPGGAITGIPFFGEHGDLNIRTKSAYAIELRGRRVLCVADSSILDPRAYQRVHDETGDADALFISMECVGAPVSWAYSAVFTAPMDRTMAESRRTKGSDCQQGIGMVECFNCRHAYVYAIGHEPWMFHILAVEYDGSDPQILESNRFVEECRRRGIESERLYCRKELVL
jgi:L-ascorbate metabolism protein UlaG (beta-lactamase superfamily)